MLEAAKKYVLSLLLENEEVKNFPKDFTTAAVQWIRSWFLKDDPSAEVVVNLSGNEEAKTKIIEAKLPQLLEDPRFVEELKSKLGEYEQRINRVKNLVDEKSEIDAGGSVTIGDKGKAQADDGYTQKNIVKGKVKAGKDVHIGDTHYRAGDNFNIVNNYFQHPSAGVAMPVTALASLKEELRKLVAKGNSGAAIAQLMDLSGQTEDFQNTAIHLSGRWSELTRQRNNSTLSVADATLERARIDVAVLELIKELPG